MSNTDMKNEIEYLPDENGALTVPNLADAAPDDICRRIVGVLDAKKAMDLQVLAVSEQTVIADYFVICTATSNTHVKALADEVDYRMGQSRVPLLRHEGTGEGTWAILDYGCVMVHIFVRSARDFYSLEKLWGDAEPVDVSAMLETQEN